MKTKPMTILTHPNPALRLKAEPVTNFGPALAEILTGMMATMLTSNGIGLAAPQVGLNLRLFVMIYTQKSGNHQLRALINPDIITKSTFLTDMDEGCLSLPDQTVIVKRPNTVTVKYDDVDGKTHIEEFTGLNAKIVQHEIDHLSGILIADHKKENA